jgi:hypothetical protein
LLPGGVVVDIGGWLCVFLAVGGVDGRDDDDFGIEGRCNSGNCIVAEFEGRFVLFHLYII